MSEELIEVNPWYEGPNIHRPVKCSYRLINHGSTLEIMPTEKDPHAPALYITLDRLEKLIAQLKKRQNNP